MKSSVKNIILYTCSALILVLMVILFARDTPIEIIFPELSASQIAAEEQERHKVTQVAAVKNTIRRIYRCQSDEECIIVDKDPCGCAVGPQGVTAINVNYTLEFNKLNSHVLTKACPDNELSKVRECSPNAKAVCRAHMCKIVY